MTMKAMVLGAGGLIGSVVAETLVRRGAFDEVVLADMRPDHIPLLEGTTKVALDVRDEVMLEEALDGSDVLVNCTTYHYGVEVLKAAIAAQVSYVDLGGLHNTPRQIEMDDAARHAEIIAVIGCGATPGLSNLLARRGMELLGGIDEVHISFASHRDLAPSAGLLDTILDEFRPGVDRYYWSDGALVDVEPFTGTRPVRFARPIGVQDVFFVPHSENHTLSRNLPGVKLVAVRGAWRNEDMELLRMLSRAGFTNDDPVMVQGTKISPLGMLRTMLLDGHQPSGRPCCFFLHIECRFEDRVIEFSVSHPIEWGARATGMMTGIPAALGAELIAKGRADGVGVRAPEAAFEPEEFLDLVAGEGISVTSEVPAGA
jgi:saccharopine dehydrogenase-like NADP-dependent oxidoreductase